MFEHGRLYEVVDLRNVEGVNRIAPVCVLRTVDRFLAAWDYQGGSQVFDVDEDDSIVIDGEEITVRTEAGEVHFVPLEPGAGVLSFLNVFDFDLLWMGCMLGR